MVKCEKCDREFHDDKAHEYPGKIKTITDYELEHLFGIYNKEV